MVVQKQEEEEASYCKEETKQMAGQQSMSKVYVSEHIRAVYASSLSHNKEKIEELIRQSINDIRRMEIGGTAIDISLYARR